MDTQIVVVFCLCDDMLKALRHREDSQCQMTDAEVMTTAIVAMLYFGGNFRLASQYMCEHGYIPNMVSRSRFNRRLHRIAELFLTLFLRLGEHWKNLNERSVYVITIAFHARRFITAKTFEAICRAKSAISMVCAFI
jgi:hypothetical protein